MPPPYRRKTGRPKKCRRRGEDEVASTRGRIRVNEYMCRKCKQKGHNNRRCTSEVGQSSTSEVGHSSQESMSIGVLTRSRAFALGCDPIATTRKMTRFGRGLGRGAGVLQGDSSTGPSSSTGGVSGSGPSTGGAPSTSGASATGVTRFGRD